MMQRIFSPELLPLRGGIIYAAVHEPSGYIYIGSTIAPRRRLTTHLRGWMDKDRAYDCGRPMWHAIHSEKYQSANGPVMPIFWLIEALEIDSTKESAHAVEQRYLGILEKYVADNGANAIPRFSVFFDDGDVAPARVANTKFLATGGCSKGHRRTLEQREVTRVRAALRAKPVEGRLCGSSEEWAQYDSVHFAARLTGLPQQNISTTCNGARKSCGGREWRFALPTP